MPMIEVDEATYASQQQLTGLYQKMMANKDARELLTKAAKVVNPNASTPELDAKEELRAELAAERTAREALQAEMAADRAERAQDKQLSAFSSTWEKQKSALRKAGWNDEGIEKIEAHAQDRGIADLEVAAAHFEKINPPPTIAQPSGYGTFDFTSAGSDDAANFKKLMEAGMEGDPAVERDMIKAAIDDARGIRR